VHISVAHFLSPSTLPLLLLTLSPFILDSTIPPYGTIPRRPQSHYLSFYEDPEDWMPIVRVTRGTPIHLRAGGLIFRDEQPHDITPLLPRDLSAAAPPVHLLGKEMIDGEASRWASIDFSLPLKYHGHQLDWTRFILTRERDILCSSGVYSCIFLSLFRYHIDTPWLCAFCERWSYSTNTLFIDDRELTPTLWEIRQLTGLPVFGHYYDEFLLSEGDLRDPSLHPASLREVYRIYDQLRGQHLSVPFRFWISYFTDRLHSHTEYCASTRDPFGTGRLDLFSDVAAPLQDTLCSHDIDRETYLTAFLSWWICFFLLPSSGARTIRPSVFVMASQIARGERVSLAVPVLANIYRSLRGLTSSRDPSRCRELVPWHFISGWLHMYWSGLYHPSLSSDLRAHLPILGDLAGTEPASLTPEDARFRFYRSHDHLRLARTRLATHHLAGTTCRPLVDATFRSRGSSPFRDQPDVLDYFISLRYGFLPLRIGDYAFIEPYSPHRCAHQFGLDQDVPLFLLHPESLAADLEGLGWCYSHLFRLGTGSHFQTVPASRTPTFSRRYIWWYYNVIRSYQSYTPSVVVRSTCPRDRGSSSSSLSYDDFISFPLLSSVPVDFQGLDSRCLCSSTRTHLTGTLQIHPFLILNLDFRLDFDRFLLIRFCI
jgi:hypothetical protein